MEEKKSTFTVLFYLKKNAPKKDGTVPIMIRITVVQTKQEVQNLVLIPHDGIRLR